MVIWSDASYDTYLHTHTSAITSERGTMMHSAKRQSLTSNSSQTGGDAEKHVGAGLWLQGYSC